MKHRIRRVKDNIMNEGKHGALVFLGLGYLGMIVFIHMHLPGGSIILLFLRAESYSTE